MIGFDHAGQLAPRSGKAAPTGGQIGAASAGLAVTRLFHRWPGRAALSCDQSPADKCCLVVGQRRIRRLLDFNRRPGFALTDGGSGRAVPPLPRPPNHATNRQFFQAVCCTVFGVCCVAVARSVALKNRVI
jgi:hypothetical protein